LYKSCTALFIYFRLHITFVASRRSMEKSFLRAARKLTDTVAYLPSTILCMRKIFSKSNCETTGTLLYDNINRWKIKLFFKTKKSTKSNWKLKVFADLWLINRRRRREKKNCHPICFKLFLSYIYCLSILYQDAFLQHPSSQPRKILRTVCKGCSARRRITDKHVGNAEHAEHGHHQQLHDRIRIRR